MIGKVVKWGAIAAGVFVAYRVVCALRKGTSVFSAIRHPLLPVDVAELADKPGKTRTGAGAF